MQERKSITVDFVSGAGSGQTEELVFAVKSRLFDVAGNDWLNEETTETISAHRSSVKTAVVSEGNKRRLTVSVKGVPIVTLNSDDIKMDGTEYGTGVDALKTAIDDALDV